MNWTGILLCFILIRNLIQFPSFYGFINYILISFGQNCVAKIIILIKFEKNWKFYIVNTANHGYCRILIFLTRYCQFFWMLRSLRDCGTSCPSWSKSYYATWDSPARLLFGNILKTLFTSLLYVCYAIAFTNSYINSICIYLTQAGSKLPMVKLHIYDVDAMTKLQTIRKDTWVIEVIFCLWECMSGSIIQFSSVALSHYRERSLDMNA